MNTTSHKIKVAVVGHPLAAPENRTFFPFTSEVDMHLWAPRKWPAKTLGHTYLARQQNQITSHPVVLGGRNALYGWLRLRPSIQRYQPDVLYAWEEPWSFSAYQLLRISRKLRIPFLFYSAEQMPKKLPGPFKYIQNKVFRHAAGAVAITPDVESRLRHSGFKRTVFQIPLGIPSYPFASPAAASKHILYIGRLISLKRVHLIIQALQFLEAFRLTIVGDGPERKALERLAARTNVADRVKFLGWVPNKDIHAIVGTCSLGVLPTDATPWQAEQFGKAALEMAMCGLPVLTSHTGHYISLSERFGTINTCAAQDGGQLAKAIIHRHQTFPSESERTKCRQTVIDYCSTEAVALRYQNAFKSCHSSR